MKPYNTIIKKRQLIISIGIILGLSSAGLLAAPSTEQAEQAVQSGQTQKTVKTKRTKKTKNAKQSATPDQPNQTNQADQSQQSVQAVQPQQPKQTKQAEQGKQHDQAKQSSKPEKNEVLGVVEVESGRAKNLIGLTGSASQGEVSQAQFEYRPVNRVGELVEMVPGSVVTQHSGSGKANQYFLRGYNLDHGTDFTTIVDGIPMNMASHAHGQGYMDLNSLIPELVNKIEYGKGPYYGEVGDFSSAGFAKMTSMNKLDQGIFKFTGGSFDYYRTLVANSSKVGDGDLLYAGEFNAYSGPWQQAEDVRKFNGMLRYTLGADDWGLSLNAKAYTNHWMATNQIPQAALNNGALGLYSTWNPTDGGNSNRYSFSSNLWNQGKDWKNDANLYVLYYDFNMHSDFTGFLNGPLGDQINQFEHRVQTGGNIEHTRYNKLFGFDMDNTVGLNFRHDEIMGIGLDHTYQRQYLSTVNLNDISETTAGAFFKNQTHWLEKFRTIAAIRGDFINNDVTARANAFTNPTSALCLANPTQTGCGQITNAGTSAAINAANSGSAAKIVISPKLSMIVGPWYDTEYFANIGYGYHSNDARGTTEQFAPADGSALGSNARISPLAWSRGGEVGARSSYVPGLNTTLAFWWLETSQELVFSGDAGDTAVNGKSYRYGVEWTNYYKPADWLTLDADLALTTARFAQLPPSDNCTNPADPTGNLGLPHPCINYNIPNSVGRVFTAGATFVDPSGLFSTIRVRHFGDMAQDSQGNFAPDSTIVNLSAGYKQKMYKLELDVFNIFDSQSSDIAYAYTSQYSPNPATAAYGTVRHPFEPRMVRGTITINF